MKLRLTFSSLVYFNFRISEAKCFIILSSLSDYIAVIQKYYIKFIILLMSRKVINRKE